MSSIAVLTSGGDAPGLNAAIRSVTKVASARGVSVWGVRNGYDGLIDGDMRPLTRHIGKTDRLSPIQEVESMGSLGGTSLGSSRSVRFRGEEGRIEATRRLGEYSCEGLVVIGGNGSMEGAHALATESDIPVIGIPSSIDNDIGLTREAIGVDSALNTIVDACDRISDTARSHHRAFIIEVMGRDSGYLAMAAAVATAADAVLLPEHGRSRQETMSSIIEVIRSSFAATREKNRVLILKAEGVKIPTEEMVEEAGAAVSNLRNVEVRGTVLGHIVRGGSASFRDRLLAGRFGLVAVDALLDGRTDMMVGWNLTADGLPTSDSWIRLFGLQEVIEETEKLRNGTSDVILDRLQRMEDIQGVLSL